MGASGGSLHKPAMSMMHAKRHELEVLPALPSEETETRFSKETLHLYERRRDYSTTAVVIGEQGRHHHSLSCFPTHNGGVASHPTWRRLSPDSDKGSPGGAVEPLFASCVARVSDFASSLGSPRLHRA